jgi:aspartyl-tRNA(Asn)/glutamyl-tRNA(Gln) amidotransferase subunit A
MDLRELAMDLRSGALTPTAHVEQALSAMDALAGTPHANLVVGRDDARARRDARRAEEEIAAGRWLGPLHGVAVAVKDNIDVEGLPTRAGSAVYADAAPATADAEVVARLRAAGAVVVAKTHLHELAYGPTGSFSVDGPAVHPHDPTRITGGSSSGSAALVALGIVALALGTDTGCSVRTPAALCGVVGLKPTLGTLPTSGTVPLSTTLDHVGLLASDVHGASVAWDVLARGAEGTGGGIQQPGVAGLRIGLPTGNLFRVLDPAITTAVARAAQALQRAGAELVEVELPHVEELSATYPVIVGAEAHATHAHALAQRPEDFQPPTRERLAAQAGISALDYLTALRTRDRLRARSLHTLRRTLGLDALLLATTPLRATPLGEDTHAGEDVRAALLRLCIPFSVLGVPAVSVPAPGVEGLPVGLQVVGIKLEERGVLRVASALA